MGVGAVTMRAGRYRWSTRPAGRSDLASLEERLGLLVVVRLGLAMAVLLVSIAASSELGLTVGQTGLPTALYVAVAVIAEVGGRVSRRSAVLLHRLMIPLDAAYLVLMTVPSGGPRSQLIVLFAVYLVAATLLGSARSALRIAAWDAFLFVIVPSFGLAPRIGQLLGVAAVSEPPPRDTALAIMGFWAVALCTAGCSSVSERELRRSRDELESLAEMTAVLEAAPDADRAGAALVSYTTGALGFRRGVLVGTGGKAVVALAGGRREPAAVVSFGTLPADDATVRRARLAAHPLLLRTLDPAGDPYLATLLPGGRNLVVTSVGHDPGAAVLVVEYGGRLTGERLARRTLLMVGQYAAQGGLALATAALLAERERLATLDGLTGLANRRHFDRALDDAVADARRCDAALTLVLLDVDHFKQVNDRHGHLVGDEVLRRLATVLRAASRSGDVVARFGGEEFALLLPACRIDPALAVLGRVDAGLAEAGPVTVTVSAGVATLDEHACDGQGLVAAADAALYQSKRSGRHRATVAAPQHDHAGRHEVRDTRQPCLDAT